MTAAEVERLNAPYRAVHLVRVATMKTFDFRYFWTLYDAFFTAQRRRPIARARVLEPNTLFRNTDGGWIPEEAVIFDDDEILNLLRKRQILRSEKSWLEADALKIQAQKIGIIITDYPNGTEYLVKWQD